MSSYSDYSYLDSRGYSNDKVKSLSNYVSSGDSSLLNYLSYLSSNLTSTSTFDLSNGDAFSLTESASYYYDYLSTQDERAYNYALTEDERAYNEYYYNTYESPAAMVSQYQEAGLNPALMYSSGSGTSSTNNSNSPISSGGYSGASTGRGPMNSAYDKMMGVLSFISSIAQVGSQIRLNEKEGDAALKNANANEVAAGAASTNAGTNASVGASEITKNEAEATWINTQNKFFENTQNIRKTAMELANAYTAGEISLNQSEEQLNDIRSKLNTHEIDKVDAEKAVAEAQRGLILAETRLTNSEKTAVDIANTISETCKPATIRQVFNEANMSSFDEAIKKVETEWQLSIDEDGRRMIEVLLWNEAKQGEFSARAAELHNHWYSYDEFMKILPTIGQMISAGILGRGLRGRTNSSSTVNYNYDKTSGHYQPTTFSKSYGTISGFDL